MPSLNQALGEDFVRPAGRWSSWGRRGKVRQVDDALVRYSDGNLLHTHYPKFTIEALDTFAAVDLTPGFVVAVHGWAGAASRPGVTTIGIADRNAPALLYPVLDKILDRARPQDLPPRRNILASALSRARAAPGCWLAHAAGLACFQVRFPARVESVAVLRLGLRNRVKSTSA